jgi:lipoyl(octanoyl) transferase
MDNNNYNTLKGKNIIKKCTTANTGRYGFAGIKDFLSNNKSLLQDKDKVACFDLGTISYGSAMDIQVQLQDLVKELNLTGIILLLEHPPVITIGNNKNTINIVTDNEGLRKQGIELVQSNRGGDVTFHGPGQLVCYPLFDLEKFGRDLSLFVYKLEQIVINTLGSFGINAERIDKLRGVFVKNEKISSVGIHVKKWVSYHGFSFNINVDLKYFKNIIACGLRDHSQTSLEKLLGGPQNMDEIKKIILSNFEQVFKINII